MIPMAFGGFPMSRDSVVLLVLVLTLFAFGMVMLYSATAVTAEKSPRFQDDTHFLKKQLLWVMVSIGAMIVVGRVPFPLWARWRGPILLLTLGVLGLVFVPGVGAQINAAKRWIRVGGQFLQPSEAAKLGIAIYLCGFAAADPERLKSFFRGFVPAMSVIAVVCGMIIIEPDIGTAVFVATVMTLTLVVAGIRVWHLVPSILGGGGLAAYYALTHTTHVMARIQTFRHPEVDPQGKGHQITQSLIALGSGGWTGVGLGQGTSKLYFLPEAHSDFIFPVIGEELGFLGASAMILLYMAIGFVGYRIMRRTRDRFAFLLSFAVTTYIILQAAMNVAVVTASMPTKGIPLPFVSAGGSSVLFTMIGVGILVNIANATERGECPERGSASCSPAGAPVATSSPA